MGIGVGESKKNGQRILAVRVFKSRGGTAIAGNRGSIAVEAAISMSITLCLIISIAFVVKIAYVYELIGHSINRTANEIASMSYIAGLDIFEEALGREEDFLEPLREFLGPLGDKMAEEAKSLVTGTLLRKLTDRDLSSPGLYDGDMRLRSLQVEGGLIGLDFSDSRLPGAEGGDVDIVVKYKLKLLLPIPILPDIYMMQRAVVRGWVGGENSEGDSRKVGEGDEDEAEPLEKEADTTESQNIWSLEPKVRGRLIQEIYKRNLPPNYPLLTRFEDGRAVKVKSINLQEPTYQKPSNLRNAVMNELENLQGFQGIAYAGVKIDSADITKRQLILVVPKGYADSEIMRVLEECNAEALHMGMEMLIEEL